MAKILTVAAILGLAMLVLLPAIVALGDDPTAAPGPMKGPNPLMPGASPGGGAQGEWGQYYGAWVPPVPVPPGVLGPSTPLPVALPMPARQISREAIIREILGQWGR